MNRTKIDELDKMPNNESRVSGFVYNHLDCAVNHSMILRICVKIMLQVKTGRKTKQLFPTEQSSNNTGRFLQCKNPNTKFIFFHIALYFFPNSNY